MSTYRINVVVTLDIDDDDHDGAHMSAVDLVEEGMADYSPVEVRAEDDFTVVSQ